MQNEARLAGILVGEKHPVRIMGVINVSPESFFRGSVKTGARALEKSARAMERAGADFIDVGAMSTAPYLKTQISETAEANRLRWAVKILRGCTALPISIDTSRPGPAEAGLGAGALVINDVRGLGHGQSMGRVAARADGVILMAHPASASRHFPLRTPAQSIPVLLKKSLARAHDAGIPQHRIVLDPGLGFFRTATWPWWKWDLETLRLLPRLQKLGQPLLIGVSRKSFIGHLLGDRPPEQRLIGSLAATTAAILGGVSLVRTHDVLATRETAIIARALRS